MELPEIWRSNVHLQEPLNVCALFFRDRATGDACGYYQGLVDVLAELRIVENDKWLVTWDGGRLHTDHQDLAPKWY
jgi:hypothetical protein